MSKYIIARIELPLEIFPDGKYETRQEHSSIDFIKCDELPPKKDLTGIDFSKILESMMLTPNQNSTTSTNNTSSSSNSSSTNITESKDTNEYEYIPKEMVSKKKREHHLKNSTFKNNPTTVKRNFSLKNNKNPYV